MQTLPTRTATKNSVLSKIKTLPVKVHKKSLWDSTNEIPDGKYKGLLSLLEPHELPEEK